MGEIKVTNPEVKETVKVVEKPIEKIVYQTKIVEKEKIVNKYIPSDVQDDNFFKTQEILAVSIIANVILFVCSSVLLLFLLLHPSC